MKKSISVVLVALAATFALANLAGCPTTGASPSPSASASTK